MRFLSLVVDGTVCGFPLGVEEAGGALRVTAVAVQMLADAATVFTVWINKIK